MLLAFTLGRVFTLSVAEILSVLAEVQTSYNIIHITPHFLILETKKDKPDLQTLQKSLGGTIKIVSVEQRLRVEAPSIASTLEELESYLTFSRLQEFSGSKSGKQTLGISVFTEADAKINIKKFGMQIKRTLKAANTNCRLVLPEHNHHALSSPTVKHNHLLDLGAELNIYIYSNQTAKKQFTVMIGKTEALQDFEDYSRRDYQRPMRDMRRGMTPPKLAQMMLNLGIGNWKLGIGNWILDPFCGLGTFVQEGLLLGYKMIGSDIDSKAIAGAKTNLDWFCNRYKFPHGKYELQMADARLISRPTTSPLTPPLARGGKIQAIVTEGTLGPPLSHFPTPEEMEKTFTEISKLYAECFANWKHILPAGGRVVLCLPAFKPSSSKRPLTPSYIKRGNDEEQAYTLLPNLDFALKNGYTLVGLIPQELAEKWPFLRLTERNTAIYDRKDQIIGREIVIFELSTDHR